LQVLLQITNAEEVKKRKNYILPQSFVHFV
jgi:hypothetical protein